MFNRQFVSLYLLLQITFSLGCILFFGQLEVKWGTKRIFFLNLSLAR